MTAKYSVHLAILVFSLFFLLVIVSVIHANESSTNLVCIGYDKKEGYNLCMSQEDVKCNISSIFSSPPSGAPETEKAMLHTTNIELLQLYN